MVSNIALEGIEACKRAIEGNPFSSLSDEQDVYYLVAKVASMDKRNPKKIDAKSIMTKTVHRRDREDSKYMNLIPPYVEQ